MWTCMCEFSILIFVHVLCRKCSPDIKNIICFCTSVAFRTISEHCVTGTSVFLLRMSVKATDEARLGMCVCVVGWGVVILCFCTHCGGELSANSRCCLYSHVGTILNVPPLVFNNQLCSRCKDVRWRVKTQRCLSFSFCLLTWTIRSQKHWKCKRVLAEVI